MMAWRAIVGIAMAVAGCGQLPAPVEKHAPGHGQTHPVQQGVVAGTVVVVEGETLYAIARRHRATVRGLIDTNGLTAPYQLHAGQRLILPLSRVHVVQRGDTLYGISRAHGVDMSELAKLNGLVEPYTVKVGWELRLPNASRFPGSIAERPRGVTKNKTAAAPPKSTAQTVAAVTSPVVEATRPRPVRAIPSPPGRAASKFLWPVRGEIIARFGSKEGGLHNDGINIAAPRGATVRAAENGVVAYAGNELRGYGKLVLIRHQGGWITAYAHNERLLVSRGDTVRRGQAIGAVGSTGNVGSPQTHFEIRRGTKVVDPLKYLSET